MKKCNNLYQVGKCSVIFCNELFLPVRNYHGFAAFDVSIKDKRLNGQSVFSNLLAQYFVYFQVSKIQNYRIFANGFGGNYPFLNLTLYTSNQPKVR